MIFLSLSTPTKGPLSSLCFWDLSWVPPLERLKGNSGHCIQFSLVCSPERHHAAEKPAWVHDLDSRCETLLPDFKCFPYKQLIYPIEPTYLLYTAKLLGLYTNSYLSYKKLSKKKASHTRSIHAKATITHSSFNPGMGYTSIFAKYWIIAGLRSGSPFPGTSHMKLNC